jgi:hypothetical protein
MLSRARLAKRKKYIQTVKRMQVLAPRALKDPLFYFWVREAKGEYKDESVGKLPLSCHGDRDSFGKRWMKSTHHAKLVRTRDVDNAKRCRDAE